MTINNVFKEPYNSDDHSAWDITRNIAKLQATFFSLAQIKHLKSIQKSGLHVLI